MLKVYSIFISVFLFLPTIVVARMADPNMLPQNTPLRPPAENVLPNFQNNINAVQEAEKKDGSDMENKSDAVKAMENSLEIKSVNEIKTQNNITKIYRGLILGVLTVIFLGVLSTVFYFYKNKKTALKEKGND